MGDVQRRDQLGAILAVVVQYWAAPSGTGMGVLRLKNSETSNFALYSYSFLPSTVMADLALKITSIYQNACIRSLAQALVINEIPFSRQNPLSRA
jgi:undecaprenyl pyrophosphate phosphatase UppP